MQQAAKQVQEPEEEVGGRSNVIPFPKADRNGRLHRMQANVKHGSILCAKCNTTLREDGPCPKCKYKSTVIKIGYEKKTYLFYLDEDSKAFTYGTALDTLLLMNRQITKSEFKPELYTKKAIEGRKFSAAWEEFMMDKEKLIPAEEFAPSTYHMYWTHYNCYLAGAIGDKSVLLIDDKDLTTLTSSLIGKSRHYIINVFSTLHSFMMWCVGKEWLDKNSVPTFPVFGKPLSQSVKRDSLTVEEQAEAFALIPEEHRMVFIFAAEVGCRPGETGLIRLEDVDRDGMLHIRRTFSRYEETNRTKEKTPRDVALSDVALEIVKAQMVDPITGTFRTKGRLFLNPAGRPKWGPYRPAYLLKLWRRAVGPDVLDHYAATRTSFATQLAATPGLSEKEWRAITGHTSEEAADRYFHKRPSRQRDLVNARRKNGLSKVLPFMKSLKTDSK
jgi:integrase